jgi:hypothetical protein
MRPTAYRRNARGLRDRQVFEGVRMRAGALFAAGHSQAEVARTSVWPAKTSAAGKPTGKRAGPETLRGAGPTGPIPRLSDQQLATIDRALREDARTHGFDSMSTSGSWSA